MGKRLKAKSLQDKNLNIKVQFQILRSVSKGIKKALDAKKNFISPRNLISQINKKILYFTQKGCVNIGESFC